MTTFSESLYKRIGTRLEKAIHNLFELSQQTAPKSIFVEVYWPPEENELSFLACENDDKSELPWDFHISNMNRMAGLKTDSDAWTNKHFGEFKKALRQIWRQAKGSLPKESKLYLMVHDTIDMFDLGSGKSTRRPVDSSDTYINPKPEDPKARKKRIRKTGRTGRLPLGTSIEGVLDFFKSTTLPTPVEGNKKKLELNLKKSGFRGFFTENVLTHADYFSPYPFEVFGIKIGDSKDKVIKSLGPPDRGDSDWNFRLGKKVVRESWGYQSMGVIFFDRKGIVVSIDERDAELKT